MGITRLRELNAVKTKIQVEEYFQNVCDAGLLAQAKVGREQAQALADRLWLKLVTTGSLSFIDTERLHEWALLLNIVDRGIKIRGRREETVEG